MKRQIESKYHVASTNDLQIFVYILPASSLSILKKSRISVRATCDLCATRCVTTQFLIYMYINEFLIIFLLSTYVSFKELFKKLIANGEIVLWNVKLTFLWLNISEEQIFQKVL